MNDLNIFAIEQLNEIKNFENSKSSDFVGFFYILEWGEKVKIGCTLHPSKRIKQLKLVANYSNSKLGMVAFSQEHTNFRDNEMLLHDHFKHLRVKGTELFDISFEHAILNMPCNLLLLNESDRLHRKSEKSLKAIEEFLTSRSEKLVNEHDEHLLSLAKRNAQVDMSEILMDLSDLDVFSADAKSVLLDKAAEILTGEPIIPPSDFRNKI